MATPTSRPIRPLTIFHAITMMTIATMILSSLSLRALPGRRGPLRAVIVIALGHLLERGRAGHRAARLAVDLRARLGCLAGGECVEDRAHAYLGQVLVIVIV